MRTGGGDTPPLPAGFVITLDPATREVPGAGLVGGVPRRVLRLSARGAGAWDELRAGPVDSRAGGLLARRLTDAGLAYPVPPPAAAPFVEAHDVTVVVPVRDRAGELDRCLRGLGDRRQVLVVDDGSSDPYAVAEVAARHGASLVRREANGGPGAARNTGLAAVASEFVAFVDSDCETGGDRVCDWIASLGGHFADPLVGAVAPRVVGHAPLDLGPRPAAVAPGGRVAYVPTAALLVRRAALLDVARGGTVFDPALRYGEDVDLVWRLHAAGWRVRYDPGVRVAHAPPSTAAARLARRYRYGTSAAPLSRRHPGALAPLRVEPWTAIASVALAARRPAAAALALGCAVLDERRTRRAAGLPGDGSAAAVAERAARSWRAAGAYVTQFGLPVLAAAAARRPGRGLALGLAVLAAPRVAHVADDAAYGAGVLAGCLRERTVAPLRPVLARTLRPSLRGDTVKRRVGA